MAERFAPGAVVRVRLDDPPGHTRAPRYVRGHRGTVLTIHGEHPLPDAVVAGADPADVGEPVYAVRFTADQLFGESTHGVTVNLWASYLEGAT